MTLFSRLHFSSVNGNNNKSTECITTIWHEVNILNKCKNKQTWVNITNDIWQYCKQKQSHVALKLEQVGKYTSQFGACKMGNLNGNLK